MNERQWGEWGRYAFGFVLGGGEPGIPELLVLINGESSDWSIAIPAGPWRPVLDTGQRDGAPEDEAPVAGQWTLKARSLAFFERAGP